MQFTADVDALHCRSKGNSYCKYWLKIVGPTCNNIIIKTVYANMLKKIDTCNNWASRVSNILQGCGYNDIWTFPSSVTVNNFIPLLKDLYIKSWREGLANSTSMMLYMNIKTSWSKTFVVRNHFRQPLNVQTWYYTPPNI